MLLAFLAREVCRCEVINVADELCNNKIYLSEPFRLNLCARVRINPGLDMKA